jgi:hypothetical protein
MKAHNGMRPHDIVVLLKIISLSNNWLNKDLSDSLYISPSEISESLNRSMIARLISPDKKKVAKNALFRFIENGISFVFPAEPGPMVKGVPTAHSAPILKEYFISGEDFVWPYALGKARGQSINPLYPNQPKAALADENLYAMLALIDTVRMGKVREREMALKLLHKQFNLDHARELS